MINPINFNKINMQGMPAKSQTTNKTAQTSDTMELSGYKAGQAILARNNVTFRNLAQPIEVTDKYNKKVEGKDHLDLPNIHVYEYPDTNLQVFVNINNNCKNSQLATLIDSLEDDYDVLKQAIINKLIAKKFDSQNLGLYYDYDLTSPIQFVSTGEKNPLRFSDIRHFNKNLTVDNFDEDNLLKVKKELIEYLASSQYVKDNNIGNLLYSSFVDTRENTIKKINSITLKDLEDYQNKYLYNASIKMFLTINNKDFENSNILKELNKDLNYRFKKSIYNSQNIINDKTQIIYNQSPNSNIKFSFCVNNDNIKDNLILELISREYPLNLVIDEPIKEPLTLKEKNNGYYRSRVSFSINLEKNIATIQRNEKDYFERLMKKDFSETLKSIKLEYKTNLAKDLKECNFSSLQNLKIANLGSDIFNVYEMIDSINEEDIKQYIKKHFIEQHPVIEIECPQEAYKNLIKEYNNEH